MTNLNGKVAVVTGGARGMGASHAKRFVNDGASVVITDILEEKGSELAKELGEKALFIQHDVSKTEDWKKVIQETEDTFGPISILVNNAGIAILNEIKDMTEEDYMKVIQVNQLSVFLGMKAVLPSMQSAGSGSIINIASISAIRSMNEGVAYDAAKGAINAMTKTAAVEFAKYNIRVNAILPGFVETEMDAGLDPEYLNFILKATPMNRRAQPEEVSSLVSYLASDDCQFQTAGEFIIDGGLTKRY
ncbi:3alpha(or 20beta)-hydroxysteroid dehydrogenase [Alteribacillus persepolensis]|uniref:3alpha(Or 20beta)-hydroxysteroid dehydrogenase n=1 Tax=Alteribacillus persepolensis TaxID=568899 RepID=A0A1G8EK44_9BACI|nr:glucose 1-dehydrogenase [Alteribacillus persepolensis]SDH70109.1 3alpha(or 20beta)-hydroxysteroid dehydrogenase [Alteribacillus persepolensis]